jgi:hypothetical protein
MGANAHFEKPALHIAMGKKLSVCVAGILAGRVHRPRPTE